MKVLITGRVTSLSEARSRLEKVHTSTHGPFHVAFAVGADADGLMLEAAAYAKGEAVFPLPFYVVLAPGSRVDDAVAALRVGTDTHTHTQSNLHFLVPDEDAITVSTAEGFSIAYGEPASPVAPRRDPVDFYFSTPATALAPRYHFAAAETFNQRAPYSNEATGTVTRLITLAPVVAGSDGKGAGKCVHALNLTPAAHTPADALKEVPPGTTPSPYVEETAAGGQATKRPRMDAAATGGVRAGGAAAAAALAAASMPARVFPQRGGVSTASVAGSIAASLPAVGAESLSADQIAALQKESDASGSQHFWNLQAGRGRGRGGGRGGRGGHFGGPGGDAPRRPPECWFCLASPQVEKHLVVSVATEAYLDVASFLECLSAMYAAQGKALMAFERVLHARRGETPVHTHMQVVGLPKDAVARAKSTWITEGKIKEIEFEQLDDAVPLATAVAATGAPPGFPTVVEYLYVEVPEFVDPAAAAESTDMKKQTKVVRLLHRVPQGAKHPVQFGREIACRILDCPDRVTWKACVVGTDVEAEQANAFRTQFAPFDFTQALDDV